MLRSELEEPLLEENGQISSSDGLQSTISRHNTSTSISRRHVMFLLIITCTLLIFIYYCAQWREPSTVTEKDLQSKFMVFEGPQYEVYRFEEDRKSSDLIEGDLKSAPKIKNSTNEFIWTWICRNTTCERRHVTEGFLLRSLITCNMLCGTLNIWPIPTGNYRGSKNIFRVKAEQFHLYVIQTPSGHVTSHIAGAFQLFKNDLQKTELEVIKNKVDDDVAAYQVLVNVSVGNDNDPKLRLDTDESYVLNLNPKHEENTLVASIKAYSFCGARNGLETLSQLIWADPYEKSLFSFEEAKVEDAPKFKYRGLLLDTARNFFPVQDIIRTLDAMGANKLNTFHWHATDSQSFPLVLNAAPQLARLGAYRPDAVYTRDDIQAVVRHAALRGIRVVIEIDTPAHVGSAFSWGSSEGVGELAYCIDEGPWRSYCGEPPCGQLNPQNEYVFQLLQEIYAEIIQLTGVTDVFHLGGDEVNQNCWRKYIKKNKPLDLWLNFTKRSYESLKTANGGKTPELTMLWSSPLTALDVFKKMGKFGVQLWGDSFAADQLAILNAGIRSVISSVDAWYFDCGMGSWRDTSLEPCSPYRKWFQVYNHRPWKNEHADQWRVVGGEACMWTELLDAGGLDVRLWPRGIALAERLWSDPLHEITPVDTIRLETQRSRLKAKGIAVDPLRPKWCTQNPASCL